MKPQNIDEFREQNPKDWKRVIDQLFPGAIPFHARWEGPAALAVLNHIGSVQNVNHLFFASGGGLDLTGAAAAHDGQTELHFTDSRRLCKIKSVCFESFGDETDYQWSYFRIDTEPLLPSGYAVEGDDVLQEELTELSPGEYGPRSLWDDRYEDEGGQLPATARLVVRLMSGSMVIFQKSSAYNRTRTTYLAPHAKLTADDFREQIGRARMLSQEHLQQQTPPNAQS